MRLCVYVLTSKIFVTLCVLISLAKQHGTDQNDGDPQYAFYRVFKSADPRVEQVDRNGMPKQLAEVLGGIELFKIVWAPQRSAGMKETTCRRFNCFTVGSLFPSYP